jgi:hypothetical protein
MSVMPVVSNYNCTVHFNFYSKWWLWFKHFYIVTLCTRRVVVKRYGYHLKWKSCWTPEDVNKYEIY